MRIGILASDINDWRLMIDLFVPMYIKGEMNSVEYSNPLEVTS